MPSLPSCSLPRSEVPASSVLPAPRALPAGAAGATAGAVGRVGAGARAARAAVPAAAARLGPVAGRAVQHHALDRPGRDLRLRLALRIVDSAAAAGAAAAAAAGDD